MPAGRPKSPPGERDLALKLAMRRVFWGMNLATRLNVKLSLPGRSRSTDDLTDVDVVGFSTGADFSIRLLIADCKSSGRVSPSSRVFWLAGVRDYFSADRAYLVLQRSIPTGAREAAGRLDIDVLADDDLSILENVHGPHAVPSPILDIEGVVQLQQLATGLDRRLQPLVQFREHGFWSLPEERRLQRLVVELRAAGPVLQPTQKAHRYLVADLLFLFAVGLFGACRFVSSTSLADPREALLAYLLGGAEQTRARRAQLTDFEAAMHKLGDVVPAEVLSALKVEPAYFDDLAETAARFLRRPRDAQRVLRFLEWWAQVQIGSNGAPATSLGPGYAEYTRKLVSDLARTCFKAADLGPEWLTMADEAGSDRAAAHGGGGSTSSSPAIPPPKTDSHASFEDPAAQLSLPPDATKG